MNLLASISALAFATLAVAQGNAITSPPDGVTVSAGSDIVVQFTRYDGLLSPYEIGIAIGLEPCPATGCVPPDEIIGSVLYTGPYKPVLHKHGQMYKNYTVTIPDYVETGMAQLNVAHFFLIGAGPSPVSNFYNITLNVV